MLVELGLVDQRYQAVLEVLVDGATVTDVARRYGVARQTVHDWLRKYAAERLRGSADRCRSGQPAADGVGDLASSGRRLLVLPYTQRQPPGRDEEGVGVGVTFAVASEIL